jgi:hypothetical protein
MKNFFQKLVFAVLVSSTIVSVNLTTNIDFSPKVEIVMVPNVIL